MGIATCFKINQYAFCITFITLVLMKPENFYSEEICRAWYQTICKPKWYSGIKTSTGAFYTAQKATKLKTNFNKGVLAIHIVLTILEAHDYDVSITAKKASEETFANV